MSGRENIHATGIVLDGIGLILRGEPGAGKSVLALGLLDTFEARGRKAMLVSDDRIEIERTRGGLVMHAPAAIAGLIEMRGRGIVRRPHLARAPLHLVVDLVPVLERMVEEDALTIELMGVTLPRCPVPRFGVAEFGHQQLLVLEALRSLPKGKPLARQKTT